MTLPPGLTVTATLPLPAAHLMFSAEIVSGPPTVVVATLAIGFSRGNTVAVEQLSDPNAFSRLPVIVSDMLLTVSPPARIRFRIARQSRVGSWALSNAATPATCGVAIDVPLNDE